MYRIERQMKIEDFVFPYGTLDFQNEWVKLAELIDWDLVEERYAAQFVNNGAPAYPARMALGSLLIKQRLKCSDRWVVRHVSENPYLQFFIGMKEYSNACPFGASTMVDFRKRFSAEDMAVIMESVIPEETGEDDDHGDGSTDGGAGQENSGTLVMDATCCPADIAYPQDLQLLNKARERIEGVIDDLCRDNHLRKPRMYRRNARKAYLRVSKNKKRSKKKLRTGIRQQLQYLRRDIGYIVSFVESGIRLTQKQKDELNVLMTLFEQQRIMYETDTHSIPNRIVSIDQHWVRPIVRGKVHANTEFGAKLHISVVNGYARIEHLDFEAFNESNDFFRIAEHYRSIYGHYPRRILADKIYRNREALAFCKENGIRLSGPALGRPPKDKTIDRQSKRQEYQDLCDRNIVEGTFGTGKTAYGLGRIMARLQETSFCVIAVALLSMNLTKRLRSLLPRFSFWVDFRTLLYLLPTPVSV